MAWCGSATQSSIQTDAISGAASRWARHTVPTTRRLGREPDMAGSGSSRRGVLLFVLVGVAAAGGVASAIPDGEIPQTATPMLITCPLIFA